MKEKHLIPELISELDNENLAIFAGAGFSMDAGYVNWAELIRPLADELELDLSKETDLVAIAQYYCNVNQSNRGKINQLLVNEFSRKCQATDNHRILARLPISVYWTTNYDKMIENTLENQGKIVDVKFKNNQLSYSTPKRDAVVYKMHGDVSCADEAILIKDDYESYHVKMQPFINALRGDLISKTFLFLGFSFSDPNLDYILSRVRVSYDKSQRPHYNILKKVSKQADELDVDYEYRRRKQDLFIQDLLRFGIKTVFVNEYSDINKILSKLEDIYRRKTVFISGAAYEYGQYTKDDAEKFIYELSKEISKNGFRVVSGFGLGIGSSVISGVLENVYMSGQRLNNDQLILRPFPQSHNGSDDIKTLWNKYREDMISYAGIAIFVFGNKLSNDEIVISNGMIDEYNLCKKYKLAIIPVGSTGYASKKIMDKETIVENKNNKLTSEFKRKLINLNEEISLPEIKKIIISMLLTLKKDY